MFRVREVRETPQGRERRTPAPGIETRADEGTEEAIVRKKKRVRRTSPRFLRALEANQARFNPGKMCEREILSGAAALYAALFGRQKKP